MNERERSTKSRRSRGGRALLGWVVGAGLVVAAILGALELTGLRRPRHGYHSVAVLPLRDTGVQPERTAYLVEGLGESLAGKLAGISGLQVAPWVSSRRYPADLMALRDISAELNAQALVLGTFRREGTLLEIGVSLVDGAREATAWTDEFEAIDTDLLLVQDRIATAIARALRPKLTGEEVTSLTHEPTANIRAYDLYLRGSFLMQIESPESNEKAMACFREALSIDPDLAEVHVGVGALQTARYFLGWGAGRRDLESAEASFREALRLDPTLMRARRGLIKVQWERGLSEECLKLGSEAKTYPRSGVEGLLARAEAFWMGGLPDEAIPLLEEAIAVDPVNLVAHWSLVVAATWADQPQRAIEAAEEFFRRFGEDPEVHLWTGVARAARGDFDSAIVHVDRALELYGAAVPDYGHYIAARCRRAAGDATGANELARAGIELLRARTGASPDNPRTRGVLTLDLALLGDAAATKAEAVRVLTGSPYPADLVLLAEAHRLLSDHATAAELMRSALRQGYVGGRDLVMRSVDLEDFSEYAVLVEEWRRELQRLRALYAN